MTLIVRITDQLRQLIRDGEIAAESNLTDAELAQRFDVSRTPVRQALNALVAEGFCEYVQNRGYFVSTFTLQDVIDAFDVRGTLEGMACRLGAETGLLDSEQRQLEENIDLARGVLYGQQWTETEIDRWHELNLAFHGVILSATKNRHLIRTVQQLRRLPTVTGPQGGRTERELAHMYRQSHSRQALADHEKILDALVARQPSRAEFLMREHVFVNREVLRKEFEARTGEPNVSIQTVSES